MGKVYRNLPNTCKSGFGNICRTAIVGLGVGAILLGTGALLVGKACATFVDKKTRKRPHNPGKPDVRRKASCQPPKAVLRPSKPVGMKQEEHRDCRQPSSTVAKESAHALSSASAATSYLKASYPVDKHAASEFRSHVSHSLFPHLEEMADIQVTMPSLCGNVLQEEGLSMGEVLEWLKGWRYVSHSCLKASTLLKLLVASYSSPATVPRCMTFIGRVLSSGPGWWVGGRPPPLL